MAHFAELDANNNVIKVRVISNESILDEDGIEDEEIGVALLKTKYGHAYWKQTSYNSNFRKNYANVGLKYNPEIDGFYNPTQPFPSWTFNEDNCLWEAPTPMPEGSSWQWSELTRQWIETEFIKDGE